MSSGWIEGEILMEKIMAMKLGLRGAAVAACMALAVLAGPARAADIPLVTGEHWTTSTEQMKKAYLVGIANLVQVEMAYEGTTPASDAQSILPRMARGLRGETLDSVREALDNWYAKNPGRIQRPVIETIWFEMVVPGLRKAN